LGPASESDSSNGLDARVRGVIIRKAIARDFSIPFDRRHAEFEQARVRFENTEREARRTGQLLATRAISTEEAEARESRFHEAKAARMAAEAARDTARLDLEHTEERAPINGRVSRELKSVGNYVNVASGMGTLLTTIVSIDPIHVYADMDENSLLNESCPPCRT
jgi:multidrug resistance efflux pump